MSRNTCAPAHLPGGCPLAKISNSYFLLSKVELCLQGRYFQIKKLTKYSLPEKALKSFTFSEFWWSNVVIFKNCCFNQLALSSSNAFLYRNKQTKETLINISTFTQLPFHTVS